MAGDEDTFLAPRLFSDEPLEANEDASFQFDAYAQTLARMIARPDNRAPFAIAVQGRWGTGKTTLMRRVQGVLNDGLKGEDFVSCKTVWFEAWRYQKQNEMFVALTRQVLRSMEQDGFLNSVRAELEDPTKKQFNWSGFAVNTLSQILSLGKIELDPAKYETTSRFQENLAFYDEFQEALNHLIGEFVSGGRLVVFIDDLDRCIPSKIVQVLEAVKLFLHTPSCVFVLGAATDLIAAAVQAHYEAEHLGGISGGEYLDKIIQVQFPLPPIRHDDLELYIGSLTGIEESTREYLSLVAQTIPTNPRRIKTFLNHVELLWAILVNGDQWEKLSKARLVEWLILQARKPPDFCDYVKGLATDQERVEAFQEMKRIADGQGGAAVEEGSPLAAFAQDQELLRVFQLGEFSFNEEAVTLCVHLAPTPTLEAPGETPPEMPPRPLTRQEVEEAVRQGQSLARANLWRASLQGANLLWADLRGADLQGANLWRAKLQGADLTRANLWRANIWRANLQGANLQGANLQGANLQGANLQGANLMGANLRGADLTGANLWEANLRGADLTGATVDVQSIDLSQTHNWRNARWDEDVRRALIERYGEESPGATP